MYRKNTAGQIVCFQGVDASAGGIKSGVTWTVRRCIDGTFAAGGGTVTEDGTAGWYKYAMAQADTNGNNISFNFTGSGAVPQTVNSITDGSPPDVNLKNAAGTAVTLDANNVLNVSAKYLAGTALTGRDIGTSVLLSSGTGTGQLKLASGYVAMTWADIAAPTTTVALTGTTIATTQKVDIDTIKTNPVVNGGTITFPTNATLASTTNITAGTITTVTAVTGLTASDVGAIKTKTDQLVFTVTNQVDVNVVDWKGATAPAMTGDAYSVVNNGTFGNSAIKTFLVTFMPTYAGIASAVGTQVTDDHGSGSYLTATSTTVSDKTGFKLASDGLDSISAPEAAGRPTTLPGWIRRGWEWLTNKVTRNRTTGAETLYGADDTTVLETRTQSTTGTTDTISKGV